MFVLKVVLALVCLGIFVVADPVPDTSEKCVSCQTHVSELNSVWSNATTVAEILKNLQTECIDKYPGDLAKIKICRELAAVFVTLPPSIFSGMEDLAWPIPDGICALLFKCQMACCGANDPPEQVHLSYVTNDHSLMGVSWVTLSDKLSVVQYGQSKHLMTSLVRGDISTYRAGSWHGTIHRAIMTDLKPGVTYYYRVGNGDRWSETLSFTTLNAEQESSAASVRYAILADMDFESNATMANLGTLIQNKKIDAVIHSGDISYADGYEPHWDVFFRRMQPVVSAVPFMVTPGNHEFWFNFTSYKHRFLMPGDKELVKSLTQNRVSGDDNIQYGSHDGMFYSWTVGPVHFIAGNSETAIDTANFSPAFLSWLEADLASVDRTKTPFIVFHFHRPMYCSNSNRCTSNGGELLRSKAEDLLVQYKVNLVIQGHVHSYERTYPMYKSEATSLNYDAPTAPVYILQGASGNREGNDGYPSQLPTWSAGHSSEVGYGVLTASSTELSFEYYVSRFEAEGGPMLVDSFTMKPWAN
jgi:3',5'-cyclic AMP phosphodiesterase CpdA